MEKRECPVNQKEVNELRRRFRPEKNAISRIYGCYVNGNREIVSYLDASLGMMPEEEVELYLSRLKKALTGGLGRNLMDIVFSTQQVMDSDEHRLLSDLRNSQLQNADARDSFYQTVIDALDLGENGYLILLASDVYDVPRRGRDGENRPDESVKDERFMFAIIKAAFAQRRKTLVNAVSSVGELGIGKEKITEALLSIGKSASVRGETFSVAEFALLSDELYQR